MGEFVIKGNNIPESLRDEYKSLLFSRGLTDEENATFYVLVVSEEGSLLGCGSLRNNVLTQIATRTENEADGLCAKIVTELVKEAYRNGETHLFLYTNPRNERLFSSLGFFPIVYTDKILMSESRKDGLEEFLNQIPRFKGSVGAVVCNCNPFTWGHRKLIESAALECDTVIVFVLSEESYLFSAEERYAMVKNGTRDIPNVYCVQSDVYLISRTTFPTYFIKDFNMREQVQCDLDIILFSKRIAPELNITRRYVGEEPNDPVTAKYNYKLKKCLPKEGITVIEIPRYQDISASKIRNLIIEKNEIEIQKLVPPYTFKLCVEKIRNYNF